MADDISFVSKYELNTLWKRNDAVFFTQQKTVYWNLPPYVSWAHVLKELGWIESQVLDVPSL